MDGNKDAKLTIRLPQELLDAAHETARRTDTPISQIVRHCLRQWVDENPPEPEQRDDPQDEG